MRSLQLLAVTTAVAAVAPTSRHLAGVSAADEGSQRRLLESGHLTALGEGQHAASLSLSVDLGASAGGAVPHCPTVPAGLSPSCVPDKFQTVSLNNPAFCAPLTHVQW